MIKRSLILMISLIGMLSLVGCPTDGGGGNNDEKKKDDTITEATSGICEEVIEVTLRMHVPVQSPDSGGYYRVIIMPTFPGVAEPEKIKMVIGQIDSNEKLGLDKWLKPIESNLDPQYNPNQVFGDWVHLEFVQSQEDANNKIIKLRYSEIALGYFEDWDLKIKLYMKYKWIK